MSLALSQLSLSFAPAVVGRTSTIKAVAEGVAPDFSEKPWTSSEVSDAAGLKDLAIKLNPVVGYWDPLNIGETSPENIGWFRHAEIKHGRVAMAAFVGYCIQENGYCWPWNLTGDTPFSAISAAGSPGDQWDALPTEAKVQFFVFVGFLELIGELSPVIEANGEKHYVRGGKPGYYPQFKGYFNKEYWPHPLPLNLFDPFGFTKKMKPERKEKALLAEVNNGRLAMLGMFGLISASKGLIVPGLDTLDIPKYAGEPMAAFSAGDSALPYVADMLKFSL